MLALRGARLFDGLGPHVIHRPLVLIEDGRIAAIEAGVEPPADAEVADLGDVTLLPGLIDTHVHLGFAGTWDAVAQMEADDDPTLILRMRRAAQQALAAGVTTVRDLGDRDYLGLTLRDWYRAGGEIGPEILAAGPPVTVTGGHCHFMGGQADGEEGVRRAVREHVDRGADVIKIMASGGNLTICRYSALDPQYTSAELAAAVDEAHRWGRLITAHAHCAEAIERAVDAGTDGIEHGGFWVEDGVDPDPGLIARIAEAQIVLCPTAGMVPVPDMRPLPPLLASRLELLSEVVGRLHAAGVPIVAGTDAGIVPVKPFDLIPHTIHALGSCGLTNREALAAATSLAAHACGVADRKGVLAVGKDADILAVAGNPLADLRALHDVRAVFRAGVAA